MQFHDALKACLRGAKIQRSDWTPETHLEVIQGRVMQVTGPGENQRGPFWASPEDLVAGNWEIAW